MNRREVVIRLLAVGLVSATTGAGAQTRDRRRRVGFLNMRAGPNEFDAAFRDGLRSLGYVEGSALQIEYRWAAGSEARAAELAAEMVASDVEIIVVATTSAIRATMRATTKIPIVMAASADPVGSGLVASLARPGGNVTGLTLTSSDTGAKRLQLLRDVSPSATQVAVLLQDLQAGKPGPDAQTNALLVEHLRAASKTLGLSLTVIGIRSGGEIASAFATMQRERVHALLVQASAVTIENGKRIAELAAQHRLPAMYEVAGFVETGGLLSYGPSLPEMYRQAAIYVDKILKGARPADLPVEQPRKFDLVVNLKTAKALGLTIPQSILLRADRLIE